ncbi:MAG: sugar transporter [Muribaculaceae bacterium]
MSAYSDSRSVKSAKNASVALLFYALSLLVQFFSRSVFINYLGADILGLNSTATSLLQFLNMAEMGLGAAVAFTLYKPIAENDKHTICEIVSVQGWFYRKICYIVVISAIILSFFFPKIFAKTNLPLWYAYSTFGVLLFSTILSYLFNYKQILLSAHQLEYKITIAYKLPKIIKDILQIIGICICPKYGYFIWVILEGIGAIVCTLSLSRSVRNEFPYIEEIKCNGRLLKSKYTIIIKKVKQLLFHKIGAFVLFQTAPLVIYAFTTLTTVAIYGNYMLLVTGLSMLLSTIYTGIGAGIGNMMQSASKQRILEIFREVYVLRYFLVVSCCFAYAVCVSQITTLWVGKEYLLPMSSVSLIILIMFLNMMRPPFEVFLQAKGLFGDIWAPIAEAVLNLGLSILFGSIWGLNGILVGVLVSLMIIIAAWKPYYLFSRGLNESILLLIKINIKLFILTALPVCLWAIFDFYIETQVTQSETMLLIIKIGESLGFTLTIFFVLWSFEKGMTEFVLRLKNIVKQYFIK